MTEASSESLRWWAIIGPRGSSTPLGVIVTPHDKTRHLATSMRLGPVSLRGGEKRFIEYTRYEPRTLDGWTERESWPVFVEGSAPLDTRFELDATTSAQVRRAAMLVSLAWREPWQVRTRATSTSNLPPTIPESDPRPAMVTKPVERDAKPSSLPEWLPLAWEQLEDDEWTARALLMWHEGLLVEPSHPSLALLAYTAAVEALSKSSWTARFAPILANRPTERFRSTIQLVARDVEDLTVRELVRWYSRRSAIVHDGTVFGHEPGVGPLTDLGTSVSEQPESDFALRVVPKLRSLTGRLIELSLRGLDPPKL